MVDSPHIFEPQKYITYCYMDPMDGLLEDPQGSWQPGTHSVLHSQEWLRVWGVLRFGCLGVRGFRN